MSQLALPLTLADHAVFASFWPAGNTAAVRFLEQLVERREDPGCFLFGPPASGKSHLLQAACARVGDGAAYLPLGLLDDAGPGVLEGLASRPLTCLDDVDRVAGRPDWEQALFALLNEVADARHLLVASASASVRESGFALADLESRLAQLPAFRLRALADADCIDALKLRARHRGLDLPSETARYLLARSRRDMASLYRLLDRLDDEALRAQRRLTVPFVKGVLEA